MVRFGGGGIKSLSELMIDTNKNWGGHEIQNAIIKLGYRISDNILAKDDSLSTTSSTTYTKVKEYRLADWLRPNTTLRIQFVVCNVGGTSDYKYYARVYRNDSPVSDEYFTSGSLTVTVDIDGWNPGDLLQIYAKHNAPYDYAAGVKNFRILGDCLLNIISQQVAWWDP